MAEIMMGARSTRGERWLIAVIAVLALSATAAHDLLRIETSIDASAAEPRVRQEDEVFDRHMDPAARAALPVIELMLSKKDVGHLEILYSRLSDEGFYLANNEWRRVQLRYAGREYDARIKSHGRQPTAHSVGRYISLSVKLEPGDRVEGMNEFKLIVRERLSNMQPVVMAMAAEAGLLLQDHDLVRVRINDWPEKLFLPLQQARRWAL